MINFSFFPSRQLAWYMVRLFVTRSIAVLLALILILMTLDLLGEAGKILAVPGNTGPLYQAGYMLGALQIREMHKELVGSGKMSDREFHDGFLRQNAMPVAMVRAVLSGEKLTKEGLGEWKFYGERR